MSTATQVLNAKPTSLTTVVVALGNGGVAAAAAYGTAFESANWTLVPTDSTTVPRYTPTIISAVATDDTNEFVLLTADSELTPGVVYGAVATGVTGIPVDGVANVGSFMSYPITSAPAARSFNLIDFIPKINKSEDDTGDLAKFIACLQEPLNLIWDLADRWVTILDSDLAPEIFVDAILADLGNPFLFADPLTLTDKRKLCRLLVQIYQLKGTLPGIQAAVQFFIGLRSEILAYFGFGDQLANDTTFAGFGELSSDSESGTPTFQLGTGTPWEFYMKLGTVLDATIPGSGSGTAATSKQVDRAFKILQVMKPAYLVLRRNLIRSGAEPTIRCAIKDNGGGSVDLVMGAIANSGGHVFFEANLPGVNQYNATTTRAATGSPPTVSALVPGATRYWNGVGFNATTGFYGLLLNEVTNALTKPVLTLAAAPLRINLSWAPVSGATSYRIYRSVASFTSPCAADNAQSPIEVSGDLSAYSDILASGTTRYYMITPVKGSNEITDFVNAFASEGFFSDIKTATAL